MCKAVVATVVNRRATLCCDKSGRMWPVLTKGILSRCMRSIRTTGKEVRDSHCGLPLDCLTSTDQNVPIVQAVIDSLCMVFFLIGFQIGFTFLLLLFVFVLFLFIYLILWLFMRCFFLLFGFQLGFAYFFALCARFYFVFILSWLWVVMCSVESVCSA